MEVIQIKYFSRIGTITQNDIESKPRFNASIAIEKIESISGPLDWHLLSGAASSKYGFITMQSGDTFYMHEAEFLRVNTILTEYYFEIL